MNKLLITTLVLTFAIAGAAIAASTTVVTTANGGQTTVSSTAANAPLAEAQPAAGKKAMRKHKHLHRKHARKSVPVAAAAETAPYTEMRVGDPRIVYHEIGTSGAQNGNTIIPFHDEPIRSSKPYEIRYDYAEFRDGSDDRR